VRPVSLRQRILRGEQTLGRRSVPFSLRLLFKCVRNSDGPVAQILPVHRLNRRVRRLEARVVDERKTLRISSVRVSLNFRRRKDHSKCGERVVKEFFVDLRVEVADENVRTDVQVFLMSRCFIYPDWLAIQFYHVHDFYRVICIVFAKKLDKTIPLMLCSHSVFRHMHIHHWSSLNEKLP